MDAERRSGGSAARCSCVRFSRVSGSPCVSSRDSAPPHPAAPKAKAGAAARAAARAEVSQVSATAARAEVSQVSATAADSHARGPAGARRCKERETPKEPEARTPSEETRSERRDAGTRTGARLFPRPSSLRPFCVRPEARAGRATARKPPACSRRSPAARTPTAAHFQKGTHRKKTRESHTETNEPSERASRETAQAPGISPNCGASGLRSPVYSRAVLRSPLSLRHRRGCCLCGRCTARGSRAAGDLCAPVQGKGDAEGARSMDAERRTGGSAARCSRVCVCVFVFFSGLLCIPARFCAHPSACGTAGRFGAGSGSSRARFALRAAALFGAGSGSSRARFARACGRRSLEQEAQKEQTKGRAKRRK